MSRLTYAAPLALMILSGLISPLTAADAQPKQHGKKYALLVGCTEYEKESIWDLRGSANDVALWNDVLSNPNGFAFSKENITRLVGWSDDKKTRPTYVNIVAAFEKLIAKAEPNVQIFVHLSGHGMAIPIPESQTDPLDPRNREPDGMDEVFLPADVKSWNRTGGRRLENAILDDQISAWLNTMRERGASVWIVFDCCHSGSMTRGIRGDGERPRSIAPGSLGVPREAIENATRRARAAVVKAGMSGELARGTILDNLASQATKSGSPTRGKMAAFFACMSYEEEVDLARPKGAKLAPENFYGLLSYTLVKIIEERQGRLTYRELSSILRARYSAERFTRPPNPYAEGDLDLEVLGMTVWPNRPEILLTRIEDVLTVNAGQLRGLTPGSVLTVLPPAGDVRNKETVLGYVRVESATSLQANVVMCNESGVSGGDPSKVENLARCSIRSQDLGDLRIKLALVPEAKLRPVFDKMNPRMRAMVQVVPEGQAEWVLFQVTPKEATEAFQLPDVKDDRVLLLQNETGGVIEATRKQASERLNLVVNRNLRKIYGGYAASDVKPLVANLERDLQKVFKAQSLWRVAGGLGDNRDLSPSHGLEFDVLLMKDERDLKGELPRTPAVAVGQILGFKITNNGPEALWYTALYCDADFTIAVYAKGPIEPGQTLPLPRARVTEGTLGMEGMIVLAEPIAASKKNPNYEFLEQEALGQAEDGTKTRSADIAPKTPFGRLMAGVAFNTGARAAAASEPTTPAIRSRNWVVLPAAKPSSR